MIETSPGIIELTKALHKAQSSLDGVRKDGKNPHFKKNYATLESVIDTAKPALQANGFAFTQAPGALINGALEITTMLMHESGEWLRSTLHVPLQKQDPQGVGSAITYGCRYALMATLGLPPVDDDAEAATDRAPPKPAAVQAAPKPPQDPDAIEAYLATAEGIFRDFIFTTEDMDKWVSEEAATRERIGLVKGTKAFDRLGALVANHRKAITNQKAAA